MQTSMRTVLRFSALVTAFVSPFGVALAAAGSASAETPNTWAPSEPMSKLEALLIFGGIPLGLFLAVAIFGALTHTKKAMTYPIRRTPPASDAPAVEAADAADQPELESADH